MNLGTAIATIDLDIDGLMSKAAKAESVMNSLGSDGGGFGVGWANAIKENERSLTSWGKTALGVGGIIIGGLAAPILAGSKAAIGQVDAVEQATVALKAYEGNTELVNKVLSELIQYAQSDMGVLFQRQDLFASAQALKMYGDNTEDLSGHVEILSRSVGLGLSNWDDLNRVVGRVGSTGRLTGQDFDYLKAAGFDLDDSLRNTNITWEELFAALDKGIPADALAGQADTIRGKTIRLQSALRGLGLAFLGVDADTSKFIEGGLGDTLMKGLEQARLGLIAMRPAAEIFGEAVAKVARGLSSVIDVILRFPQGVKTAILVATGLAGALLVAGGAVLLLLPKIANVILVIQNLGGMSAVIGRVTTAFRALTLSNPLFWALTAAVAAFVAYKTNFWGFRDAVDAVVSAFMNLGIVKSVSAWLGDLVGILAEALSMLNLLQPKEVDVTVKGDDKYIQWIEQPDGSTKYAIMHVEDDGTVTEYGEIIESYTDENDPNIAHVRIKGEDGEFWTTVDKTNGDLGDGTVKVKADTEDARSGLDKIRDSLEFIASAASAKDMPILSSIAKGAIKAVNGIEKLSSWFGKLSPVVKQVAVGAGIFLLALKPIIAVATAIAGVFSSLMTVLSAVGAVIAFILSPIGLIVIGIAALAAGLVYAYTHFEGFRNAVDTAAGAIKSFASDALDVIISGVTSLIGFVKDLNAAFQLAGGWSAAWDIVKSSVIAVRDAIVDVVNAVRNFSLDGFVSGAWGAIQSGIQLAWNAITSLDWSMFVPRLEWATWIGGKIADIATWVWDKIGGFFPSASVIGGAIADVATWIWGKISSYFPGAAIISGTIGDVATWVWGKISSYFPSASLVTGSIGDVATWIWGKISSHFPSASILTGSIGDIATWVWGKISSYFPSASLISGTIGDIATWIWGKISAHFPSASLITGTIGDIATWVWGKISSHFPSASILTGSIGDVATWVWGKISSYFPSASILTGSIGDVATWVWGKISGFFPSALVIGGAISDFASWLWEKLGSPTLTFPTKGEILNALTFGVFGDSGSSDGGDYSGIDEEYARQRAMQGLPPEGTQGSISDAQTLISISGQIEAVQQTITDTQAMIAPFMSALENAKGAAIAFVSTTIGVMGGWTTGITTMLTTVSTALNTDLSVASTTAQTALIGFVAATIGVMGGWSVGLSTILATTSQTMMTLVSGATTSAQAMIVGFVAATIGVMGGWTGGISTMVTTASTSIRSQVSSATSSAQSSIVGFVGSTIGVMGGWSSGMTNIVRGATSSMVGAASSGMSQMANAFGRGGSQAASALRGSLSRVPGIVASVGGSAAGAAYSVGANISNAMASGMRAALGSIQAAANQMVAAAQMALVARAMIHSPSRLFMGYGENVGKGFEIGIRSMIPDVASATSSLIHDLPTERRTFGLTASPTRSAGQTTVYQHGDIIVHQQPGEDGDMLAHRIVSIMSKDYDGVNGLKG